MFSITHSKTNKDIPVGMDILKARRHYLELHESYNKRFKSKLKPVPIEFIDDRVVLRYDKSFGFKAHAAEKFIASVKEDVVVYCAPRVGHAACAIAMLAKLYGKKAVFFAPASKEATPGQLCVLAYGADIRFVKIAAMPVLNSYAKQWAENNKAKFLPFGLAGVQEITAAIVTMASKFPNPPKEFWCATSTGTMIRGLQIGWPKAIAKSVAVARNMHDGEIGNADIISSELPFLKLCKTQPPFPSTACYDAKAWERCLSEGRKGSYFINVGSDDHIMREYAKVDKLKIKSDRQWGDLSDLERGL